MNATKLAYVALALIILAVGYYVYQEQQKEKVSIKLGDSELSIEAE